MKKVIKASTNTKTVKSIYNSLFQIRDLIEEICQMKISHILNQLQETIFYDRIVEAQEDMYEGYKGKVILQEVYDI